MNRFLFFALPEILMVVGAFLILGLDYGIWRNSTDEAGRRRRVFGLTQGILFLAILAYAGILVKIGFQATGWQELMWKLNPVTVCFKIFLLVLTWGSVRIASQEKIRQASERAALFLLGSVGMGVVLSSNHLLLLFVGLETFAISVYALAVLGKKEPETIAATFQFFVAGSLAAAFFFYGMGLLDGMSRSLYLGMIQSLPGLPVMPMASLTGIFLLVAIGFKIAAAPFHFWAPDFYRSAPISVISWIAGASKALGAYVLMLVWLMFHRGEPLAPSLRAIFYLLSVMSLVVGTLGALRQTHVGRLMAFGSVAHAGFLLMAAQAATVHGAYAMIYHALAYGPAALTVFWILSRLPDMKLETLSGLSRKSPAAAIYLSVAVLSLAGVPPLGGFFGKYYLFAACVATYPFPGWSYGLLVLALLMAAIGIYYYLQILKRVWILDPDERGGVTLSWGDHTMLGGLLLVIVGLGIAPEGVIRVLVSGW